MLFKAHTDPTRDEVKAASGRCIGIDRPISHKRCNRVICVGIKSSMFRRWKEVYTGRCGKA